MLISLSLLPWLLPWSLSMFSLILLSSSVSSLLSLRRRSTPGDDNVRKQTDEVWREGAKKKKRGSVIGGQLATLQKRLVGEAHNGDKCLHKRNVDIAKRLERNGAAEVCRRYRRYARVPLSIPLLCLDKIILSYIRVCLQLSLGLLC